MTFLLQAALKLKEEEEEEEEERKKREEQEELHSLRAVPPERRSPQQITLTSSCTGGPRGRGRRGGSAVFLVLPPHVLYALGNLDVLPRDPCLPGHVLCLVTCSCVSLGGLLFNFTQFLRAVTLRCLDRLGNTVVWGLLDSGHMRCVSLVALFALGYGFFSKSSCT